MNRLWLVAGALAITVLAGCGNKEPVTPGVAAPAGAAGSTNGSFGGPPGSNKMPRSSAEMRAMAAQMGTKVPPARN